MMKLDPLSNLEEALVLASIRNECRHLFTHDQQEISPLKQTYWFKQVYTQQNPPSYWVWLLKEINPSGEAILGYFAAKEIEEGFYITEGVLEKKRGKGLGTFMLNTMIPKDLFNKKPLYADIFNHNYPSVHLHKKFGFEEYLQVNKQVTRFVLRRASC
jgi:RimJ/RimL family protein N-acetyltransferase